MVILRLSRPTSSLTASVFEELFAEQLGAEFSIVHADTAAWWRELLGPPGSPWRLDVAANRLARTLHDADAVAPNYEAVLLAPLFLALRNRARLQTRLLLVAHAPGAWALEWALMGRLLAAGDVIVAPSANAAALIAHLNPAVAPFVTVIPHPMAPLEATAGRDGTGAPRIVSLGRIHPTKLLHRLIEAMDVLRTRLGSNAVLEIAGEAQTRDAETYLRALQAKVERLELKEHVRFVGTIRGRAAKARFLAGAAALVNLSVTVEESFGKAPVEALGCGVPVLATRWDGLAETVGECGVLLPVDCGCPGVAADISGDCIADGLQRLLAALPSVEACRAHAVRFAPAAVLPRYRAALERARVAATVPRGAALAAAPADSAPAAPDGGLLATAAPLTTMSWGQLFSAYRECGEDLRRSWDGDPIGAGAGPLRAMLLQGTRGPVEAFLAGRPHPVLSAPRARAAEGEFIDQVAAAAVAPGSPSTRVACLVHLWQAGRVTALRTGLRTFDEDETPALRVLRAEAAILDGDLTSAFDEARTGLDLHRDDGVTAFRLRQVARIARAAGDPRRAVPLLRDWLERFPDSPDSGPVWLDWCLNAAQMGLGQDLAEANAAMRRARMLLGESPVLDKVEQLIAAAMATAAVSD